MQTENLADIEYFHVNLSLSQMHSSVSGFKMSINLGT